MYIPKSWILSALFLGLILAIGGLYFSVKDLSKIRPASDYIDQGVYTFIPYQIAQKQQKVPYEGPIRRFNYSVTVYYVKYKTTAPSCYQYIYKVGREKSQAQEIVNNKESIEKRVLLIAETNKYICIEPSLDAELYTDNKAFGSRLIAFASLMYIGFLILLFSIRHYKSLKIRRK